VVRIITRVAGWPRVRRLVAGGFDPIEDGHLGIHHHRVGPQPYRRDDHVGAVGGFADGGVGLVLQDLAQPDPAGTTFEPP
jgi:hypothetical protein